MPPGDYYEPFICGVCGLKQYVHVGDPEDRTLPDVDAADCHACGGRTMLCDEEWLDVIGEENVFVRPGKPGVN